MQKNIDTIQSIKDVVDIPESKMEDFKRLIELQTQKNDGSNQRNLQYKLRKNPYQDDSINEQYKQDEILKLAQKYKCLCLLGVTGHGKSATGNTLLGQQQTFQASESNTSITSSVKGKISKWFGDQSMEDIIVIDTPGIADSEGRDSKQIPIIVKSLKTIGFVHSFMLVINSEEMRFNQLINETISLFKEIFGDQVFQNMLVCFTHFDQSNGAMKKRTRGSKKTRQVIVNEYTQRFKNEYNYLLDDEQFVFIDNDIFSDQQGEYEEEEIKKFEEAKAHIRQITQKRETFLCQDIKNVQKLNDRLKAELEQTKKDYEERIIQEKQAVIKEERNKAKVQQDQLEKRYNDQLNQSKIELGNLQNQLKTETEKLKKEKVALQKKYESNESDIEKLKKKIKDKDSEIDRIRYQQQQQSSYSYSYQVPDYTPIFSSSFCNALNSSNYSNSYSSSSNTQPSSTSVASSSVHLRKDGQPDMRYRENRTFGYNADMSLDMRCSKNKN